MDTGMGLIDFFYEKIKTLEKQLEEKEAMIDWLVNELTSNTGLIPVKDWRKATQEAVKKNG